MDHNKDKAYKKYQSAWVEESRGNLEGAIKLINEAILLQSDSSIYWATKGQFLFEQKEYQLAEQAAEKSVQVKPKNHHGWVLLGEIHIQQRRFRDAANCFAKAIEIKPDFGTFTLLAAAEYEFDTASAIRDAEEALKLNPNWEEARLVLEAATAKKKAESDEMGSA